jgi:MFS family permease
VEATLRSIRVPEGFTLPSGQEDDETWFRQATSRSDKASPEAGATALHDLQEGGELRRADDASLRAVAISKALSEDDYKAPLLIGLDRPIGEEPLGLGARRNTWGSEHSRASRAAEEGVHAMLVTQTCKLVHRIRESQSGTSSPLLSPRFDPSRQPSPQQKPRGPPAGGASVSEASLVTPAQGDLLLWTCATTFFMYDMFARLQLNVIMPELLADFDSDAATISSAFGSAWFMAYAAMQLPVGILFDSVGPHRIIAIFAALCALGTLVFASAHTVALACAGRVLTGVGCGGAFLGIVVAASTFAGDRMGFMLGVSSVTGFGLGAFGAAAPFRMLIGRFGWRVATMLSTALPALVCVALLPGACNPQRVRVPPAASSGGADKAESMGASFPASETSVLAQIRAAASQPSVWLWGLLGGGLDAQCNVIFGLLGFSLLTGAAPRRPGVRGTPARARHPTRARSRARASLCSQTAWPFASDANGWSAPRAALAMSLISVPVGLSNFAGSAVCSWIQSTRARCSLVIAFAVLGLGGLGLLAWVNSSELAAWVGLTAIALSIGGEGTLWVMVAEGIADDRAGGAVGGLVNTLIVLVDALAQPMCAYIVGRRRAALESADGAGDDTSPLPYSAADFRAGFVPLALLYGLVIVCAHAVRDARADAGRPSL